MFSEKASLFAAKYFPYGATVPDVISAIEKSTTILENSYAIRSDYSNIIKDYRDIAFFSETAEIKQLINSVFSLVGNVNYDISCVCSINADPNIDFQKKKLMQRSSRRMIAICKHYLSNVRHYKKN